MSEKPKRSPLPPPPTAMWERLTEQFRLSWRLFQDSRVPLRIKLIPIMGLAYLISPFGFIPALIPVIGQLDALAVILLIVAWFNYAAPRPVVNEHLAALRFRAKRMRRPMADGAGLIFDNQMRFTEDAANDKSDEAAVDDAAANDSEAPDAESDTPLFSARGKP